MVADARDGDKDIERVPRYKEVVINIESQLCLSLSNNKIIFFLYMKGGFGCKGGRFSRVTRITPLISIRVLPTVS